MASFFQMENNEAAVTLLPHPRQKNRTDELEASPILEFLIGLPPTTKRIM
jgi:hypothetical protein